MGLVSALQVEEEVRGREKQLNTLLGNKKTMKVRKYAHYSLYSGYMYNPHCVL